MVVINFFCADTVHLSFYTDKKALENSSDFLKCRKNRQENVAILNNNYH